MSATFTCPDCAAPYKQIQVPHYAWGVFVSDVIAERLASVPREDVFDRFGWNKEVESDLPKAISCNNCGWIGRWPQADRQTDDQALTTETFVAFPAAVQHTVEIIGAMFKHPAEAEGAAEYAIVRAAHALVDAGIPRDKVMAAFRGMKPHEEKKR